MPPTLAARFVALLITLVFVGAASAQDGLRVRRSGGLFGIDRFDEREDNGIYSRSNQKRLDVVVLAGLAATALWEGTDSPLGKTTWQAVDATLTTALVTEAMKNVFSRPRPSQNSDPNVWFAGKGHKSFPSGEAALMATVVTPYILALHEEYPAAWGLLALPLYMGKARMASQAHWLSDVLVGAAVGFGMGYCAYRRDQPLVLTLASDGVIVGWKQRF